MYLAGHVAVAYLAGRRRAHRAGHRLRALLPTVLGALLPDLIDKPIVLLGLSLYGRTLGHAVWVWAWLGLLWMIARARRVPLAPAMGWLLVGGLSHLAADVVDDLVEGFQSSGFALSTWGLWPQIDPDLWYWRVPHVLAYRDGMTTVLEVATLLVACASMVRDGRSGRVAGG